MGPLCKHCVLSDLTNNTFMVTANTMALCRKFYTIHQILMSLVVWSLKILFSQPVLRIWSLSNWLKKNSLSSIKNSGSMWPTFFKYCIHGFHNFIKIDLHDLDRPKNSRRSLLFISKSWLLYRELVLNIHSPYWNLWECLYVHQTF